jgi:hypothetical protein
MALVGVGWFREDRGTLFKHRLHQGGAMPNQRMLELCRKIADEKSPKRLIELTDELISLLAKEQDVIKTNIAKAMSKSA